MLGLSARPGFWLRTDDENQERGNRDEHCNRTDNIENTGNRLRRIQ